MSYATLADLENRFGTEEILELSDRDGDGQIDAGVIADALADADAVIDTHLRARYAVPLVAPIDPAIVQIACDLARRRLYGVQPPEEVRARDEQARRQLIQISQGIARIAAAAAPTGGVGAVQVKTTGRVFDRASLGDYT